MADEIMSVARKSFLLMIFEAYKSLSLSYFYQRNSCIRERDLLILAFTGTLVLFLANVPVQIAKTVSEADTDVTMHIAMLGFISIFFMPLFLYFLSSLLFGVFKVFKGKSSFYELRLAFFWSINVAAPLLVLNGLLNGFFFNVEGIKYVNGVFQCGVSWIMCTMLSEAEQFKSRLPLLAVALLIIILPLISSKLSLGG